MTRGLSEFGRLSSVLVKHARAAFVSDEQIGVQWKGLNYSAPPRLARAVDEYDRFLDILASTGAELVQLPACGETNLDSIYTRDASVVGPGGVILCRMGKRARSAEPAAQELELRRRGRSVLGSIVAPGVLEGGDLIWLDPCAVAVGQGRRTNAAGIRQLRTLLGGGIDELIVVPLPEYPGHHDVMHLMSLVSPVDRDLAVVYARLLPESFLRTLIDRGYRLVEVPDAEFDSMGTNVLALGPRDCVMVEGNPRTREALERAGARVQVYSGAEISLKGGGGPTCLTRPLARMA